MEMQQLENKTGWSPHQKTLMKKIREKGFLEKQRKYQQDRARWSKESRAWKNYYYQRKIEKVF